MKSSHKGLVDVQYFIPADFNSILFHLTKMLKLHFYFCFLKVTFLNECAHVPKKLTRALLASN